MSRSQLKELGFTKQMVRTMIAREHLTAVHAGVLSPAGVRLSPRGRWMAAVLACGDGALLSHGHALALRDLQAPPPGAVDVTATSNHKRKGIRCHRTTKPVHSDDRDLIDAIPTTTLERALLDYAEIAVERRLISVLEEVQRRNLLWPERIEQTLARNFGRRGAKPLTNALAQVAGTPEDDTWFQSKREKALRDLLNAHGLSLPEFNVYVEGELVDAVYREQRLVVEVDGFGFHRSRRKFKDDRRRDLKLQLLGYRVIRFPADRVKHEPNAVAADIRALLAATPGTVTAIDHAVRPGAATPSSATAG